MRNLHVSSYSLIMHALCQYKDGGEEQRFTLHRAAPECAERKVQHARAQEVPGG